MAKPPLYDAPLHTIVLARMGYVVVSTRCNGDEQGKIFDEHSRPTVLDRDIEYETLVFPFEGKEGKPRSSIELALHRTMGALNGLAQHLELCKKFELPFKSSGEGAYLYSHN